MIFQVIAAMIGTFFFSILFSIPMIYCVSCAIIGAIGWLSYLLFIKLLTSTLAILLSAMIVVFLSRVMAIIKKCPASNFLIAGIFPLIPGAGIYWTTYYLVNNEIMLGLHTGYDAIASALALVLGIVFIFEIPQSFFLKIVKLIVK